MFFIILIPIVFSLLFFLIKRHSDKTMLLSCFKAGNVLVYGRKGKGKDLLFQYVINKRNKKHYANMSYGNKTILAPLYELQCHNNDFGSLINDNINKFTPFFEKKRDYYITDAGIHLPSQYNHILNKQYMGMPIFAALSRQLLEMNVHANTQAINRIWKSFREQVDTFCWVRGHKKGLFFIRIDWVLYWRESDALAERLPQRVRALATRKTKDEIERYNHSIGNPYAGSSYLFKPAIKFDTYYFGKVFLSDVELAPNFKRTMFSKTKAR